MIVFYAYAGVVCSIGERRVMSRRDSGSTCSMMDGRD